MNITLTSEEARAIQTILKDWAARVLIPRGPVPDDTVKLLGIAGRVSSSLAEEKG